MKIGHKYIVSRVCGEKFELEGENLKKEDFEKALGFKLKVDKSCGHDFEITPVAYPLSSPTSIAGEEWATREKTRRYLIVDNLQDVEEP